MKTELDAMTPRKDICGYGTPHGIPLKRFFELGDWELPKGKEQCETLLYFGFNKGREPNGSDDDTIGAYFTPMILDDDTMETGLAINWEQRPSDMRLGDYLKN